MKDKGILLWVAGFAGVLLIYAAYKNKSITNVLAQTTHGTGGTPSATPANATADITLSPSQAGAEFITNSVVTPDTPDVAFDGNGYPVNVPQAYANTPGTFIPSINAS